MLKRRLLTPCLAFGLGAPVLAALPGDSTILAILGISFLIFVHEWGHFMACRLTGTRTETFSIGFGPRVFGWEKDREGRRRFTIGRRQLDAADHAMDFRVAAIPLGGYVKMAGEIPGEGAGAGPPSPDEFPAKSAAARTLIVSAGVIMNFITAVVLYFLTIQLHKSYRAPIVGEVAPGRAAWHAGIEPGDRVLSVGGEDTPTWIDLQMEIAFASPDEAADVVVRRDGRTLDPIQVRPVYDEERGILQFGIAPVTGIQIGAGETAFDVGPDEAVTIAGVPVRGGAQAYGVFQAALVAGLDPIPLERASGEQVSFVPQPADPAAPTKDEAPSAKLGLTEYAPPIVLAVRGRAKAALLEVGDQLVAVLQDGERVPVASANAARTLLFERSLAALVVLRSDEEVTLDLGLSTQAEVVAFLRDLALESKPGNRVMPLEAGHAYLLPDGLYRLPGSPAAEAGIGRGARVVQVGATVTRTWDDIRVALGNVTAGEPLPITLMEADGTKREVPVTPATLVFTGKVPVTLVDQRERFQTGGVGESLGMGVTRTVRETKNVFRTIGALFTGNISFNKNIAGPITLVTASKRFAEDSLLQLIWFLAYVSVMLAVLNILPIPVLDGGMLVFILVEKLKGSPLNERTMYRFQQIGMLLLLVLMFFAFKNDITRLIN